MDASEREYVLYLRKSRGRAGISRQRTVTTAHVERLRGTVAAEFADADRTAFQRVGGTRPERENFDAMLAYIRARPGLGVAAWHADRLIRNSADTETLIEACAQGAHLVETPSGGSYDLGTANGRKRLRSDAIDAAYEVDHAIERITAQKLEAAAEGAWLGGPVPFGWQKSADGTLILCDAEAAAVSRATGSVLRGASLHEIARRWNDAGLTTKRGHTWRSLEVRAVLLRARNGGLHVHQGRVTNVKGRWPAIVTEDEWRACRAVLADPGRRTSPGPGRRWLLSGILACGVCDAKMMASTTGGKGRGARPVYRCREGAGIVHVARDCKSLDEFVTGYVLRLIRDRDKAGRLLAPAPDLTLIDIEIAAIRAQYRELTEQTERRVVSAGWAAGIAGTFEADLERLRERRAALIRPMALSPFAGRDPRQVWEDETDLDGRRAVIASLVTVKVNRSPKGRPAGWKAGQPYFDSKSVAVTPI